MGARKTRDRGFPHCNGRVRPVRINVCLPDCPAVDIAVRSVRSAEVGNATLTMARKIKNSAEGARPAAGPAALDILEWDEGGPYSQGWFGVEITYRRAADEWRGQDSRSRLVIDCPEKLPGR